MSTQADESHPCNSTPRQPQDRRSKLTPEERSLRARIAGNASWAKTPAADRAARTAPARKALEERFAREAGLTGDEPEAERDRRIAKARKVYYDKLALKSAIARRRAKELTTVAERAEQELADGGAA